MVIVEPSFAELWRLGLYVLAAVAGGATAIAIKHLSDPKGNTEPTRRDSWYIVLAVSISAGAWLLGAAAGIDPFTIYTASTGVTTPLGLLRNVITWRRNGSKE